MGCCAMVKKKFIHDQQRLWAEAHRNIVRFVVRNINQPLLFSRPLNQNILFSILFYNHFIKRVRNQVLHPQQTQREDISLYISIGRY